MALDDATLRNAVRFVEILHNTETYPAAKMQTYQRRLLERLVRHAKAEVPFYATRLDPLFGADDTIRWEAWSDIPAFTRSDAQQAGDTLFAKDTPAQTGAYSEETTSGSTGMPLRTRRSALMGLMGLSINQRFFNWHAIDPDASICFIMDEKRRFPYPEGQAGDNWNLKNPEAPGYNLSVGATVAQQVEWLVRRQPGLLCTYPRNAEAIVEAFVQQGLPIPFHTVLVHGEVLEPDTSRTIEAAGLKLINRFGSVEVGPISAQCPEGPWHHQYSEVAFMEALSPDGESVIDSGRGQLVVTPFYNYAMPLIRYSNGDQIDLSPQPCPCGRTLPRIERILGRERNMFTFSDGSRKWPNMMRSEYEPFLSAKQFQVIQHTATRLEVRYVADDVSRPVDLVGFTALLQDTLHRDITVELTRVPELSRAASGKFETWISHVNVSGNRSHITGNPET